MYSDDELIFLKTKFLVLIAWDPSSFSAQRLQERSRAIKAKKFVFKNKWFWTHRLFSQFRKCVNQPIIKKTWFLLEPILSPFTLMTASRRTFCAECEEEGITRPFNISMLWSHRDSRSINLLSLCSSNSYFPAQSNIMSIIFLVLHIWTIFSVILYRLMLSGVTFIQLH